MMKKYITLTFLIFFSLKLLANGNQPLLKTKKINDNLYVIFAGIDQGSHVGVSLADDHIVLIDSMVDSSQPLLAQTLKSISDKPVAYVINTHDHFDHVGSNVFFAKQGATIVTQESAYRDVEKNLITFNQKLTLHTSADTIKAFHAVSHSSNDTIIHLKNSNVIFMGDLYTTGWYPALFQGGISGQNKAIDLALSLANEQTIIVPGHGEISNINDLKRYQKLSNLWVSRIMHLHNTGNSIEHILKDTELLAIRDQFATSNTRRDRFDKLFIKLVENTIKVETGQEF